MRKRDCLIAVMLAASAALPLSAQSPPAAPLYELPDAIETRWASPENPTGARGAGGEANAGRKGRPAVPLAPGARLVLAEASGRSGTVRRIWMTIIDRGPRMLRGLRIDMFWDGAARPAVSAPVGDFFCHGLGRMATFENALFASPEGRSFVSYVPMPFRTGMRIVVTNETGTELPALFYDVDYTLGDRHPPNALYFHAWFNRERPTSLQRDYEILGAVRGAGRFLGATIGVIADTAKYAGSWWGEGEVKMYVDGDGDRPTLVGTGTEDYIGTGWGQGRYANLYQGSHIADAERMQYAFYRLHVPDPVIFRRDLRVTIQQIGWYAQEFIGHFLQSKAPLYRAGPGLEPKDKTKPSGLFERQDDWSSCAYFYLDRPENDLPPLPPLADRLAGLDDRP